jgi:formate hydrogenlyase transcriptional activator
MPSGLFESQLFGHERGAFTGAVNSHVGRFSLADRGTLFLDEIGDMRLELQPKILRVLQEREFEAIGSTRTTKVDVRVIAATNQDLQQMVSNQEFREDLFYRLHIFPIFLPPLRERKTDIAGLVTHFVKQFSVSMNKDIRTISDRAMRSMINHSWPGNVRELQNYVARGVILARGTTFDLIPPDKRVTLRAEPTSEKLEDTIRGEILAACHKANWQIGGPRGAAARLGLKRTTLFYKMKRLGISPPAKPS